MGIVEQISLLRPEHTHTQSASARATWMFGSAEKASPYFYVYFVYSNEADFFRLSLAIWCKSNGQNSSPTLVSIKSHSEKLSSNACKYVRSHRIWSTRTSLAAAAAIYNTIEHPPEEKGRQRRTIQFYFVTDLVWLAFKVTSISFRSFSRQLFDCASNFVCEWLCALFGCWRMRRRKTVHGLSKSFWGRQWNNLLFIVKMII